MAKRDAFDEITGFGDAPRPGLAAVSGWLNDTPRDEMTRLLDLAEAGVAQLVAAQKAALA